uniref:Uncharacterized protein n=1 Tax=Nelumbo nucifera TaxID=4432 RepID=A0A822XMG3_NELNU|nr:TPA_asm: hypothetical protein HUJ06_021864 [Nelumbo nucifera]
MRTRTHEVIHGKNRKKIMEDGFISASVSHEYDFMWADNYTPDEPQVQIIEQHNNGHDNADYKKKHAVALGVCVHVVDYITTSVFSLNIEHDQTGLCTQHLL